MTAIELARLVRSMRELQREYFKVRSPDLLARSKAVERQVDRAVAEVFDQVAQGRMFDRPDDVDEDDGGVNPGPPW